MRVVGFVPSKLNSKRLPRKNVLPLGGSPLINHVVRTLTAVEEIDDIVVFASDTEVMGFLEDELRPAVRFVRRPASLDADSARVQDFVGGFLERVECDVVVLLHATSPFISASTVRQAIQSVVEGRHDSAFAALEMRRFAWFRGSPLNYDPARPIPRTQDLDPIIVEQSGFYVFTRELFETSGRRVGNRPHILLVDEIEGHDIDTSIEFELAEQLLHLRGGL